MRCRKNDYFFADYDKAAIWSGDMYECEGCKARVVVGVAREPMIVKGEPNFEYLTRASQLELKRA
jgi:hypothetical protein